MTGTEGIAGMSQAIESLDLRMQTPMVIPKEIKNLELSGQLPKGDIAYIDVSEPDTIRLVDQETWHPITKGGIEKRANFEHAQKRFAAIILHTPSRTPENSYTENIHQVSNLLKIHVSKDGSGATTGQDLGTLFIVEDKGKDTGIGWRQKQLTQEGLVVNPGHNKSVITTDKYVITCARRRKKRLIVDLGKGVRSRNMVPPFIDSIQRRAEQHGLTADSKALEREWHATKNVRRTLSNIRDGNNVTFEGMDDDGHPIHSITEKGVTTVYNEEGLRNLTDRQEHTRKPPKVEHKLGDRVVRNDLVCDACGNHPQDIYIQEPGRVRWLLFKETACYEPHRDNNPRYFGKNQYIKPLGFILNNT